ncbi:MAG: amidohydrolase family protein [Thermoleophilia bacterium]
MTSTAPLPSEPTRPGGPVIDVHVHVFAPDVIRDRVAYTTKDDWFRNLYTDPKSRMVTYEQVIEEMDATGVDRSVIFGFAYRDQELCRGTNDYVMEAVRAHPSRFVGLACVSPEAPGAVRELERCLDAGLAGCGELFPGGQGFDVATSAGLDEVAAHLTERGLFLNLHSNEPVGHEYPGKDGTTPGPCYEFARRHPDLKTVLSHMGGGLFFYELIAEARNVLRNVYYDTSAVPYVYRRDVYSLGATSAGPEKILFGSDYPLLSPRRYLKDTEDLDQTIRSAIFGRNAAAALGVDDTPAWGIEPTKWPTRFRDEGTGAPAGTAAV